MTRRRIGDPAVAIAYLRVSTDEQTLGIEAQRAAIESWAERGGVCIVAWHSDIGISGGAAIDKRPGLLAALAAIAEHRAGVFVAAKRDRIARDVVVAAMTVRLAEGSGARVRTADGLAIDDGPEGKFTATILDAVSQLERAQIGMRTRAALAAKRARGELTGTAPYGTRVAADGVRLESDPAEAAAVARVLALRREGGTMRGIAERLNAEGVPARGPGGWHRQTIWRILHAAQRPASFVA